LSRGCIQAGSVAEEKHLPRRQAAGQVLKRV